MNIVSRITNQSAIDYYQISGSRRAADPTFSPGERIKNEHSLAKGSLFRGFYSTTKLPAGKSSTSISRIPDDIGISRTSNDVVNPSRSSAKECLNEPRIRFDEYRINGKAEIFKFCLVGKFPTAVTGARLEQVKEMASGEWNLQGGCSITLLDQSHLFIRLENEVDMIRVWPRNQWFVNGEVMKVFKWTPMFRPSDGELPSAAVWMKLPYLPLVFYQEDLLCQIASLVGKVLCVDDDTRNLIRTDSARVCVEVDLLKELPCRVWIEVGTRGFWQTIECENKPCFCTNCSAVGHKTVNCKKKMDEVADDIAGEDTSRFEIKNCGSRMGNYYTTSLVDEMRHAHSLKGGSEIIDNERNTVDRVKSESLIIQDALGCTSGQVSENVNGDTIIESSQIYEQPLTKPVLVIEELMDAEDPLNVHRSSKRVELEMGTGELVYKTQSSEDSVHGAISSKAVHFSRSTRKQDSRRREPLTTERIFGFSAHRFSYKEIKKACKNFREVIGEGGFGRVYRGKLGNQMVAIKRWSSNSFQGRNEFEREIMLYSLMDNCTHLVSLVSYCNDNYEMFLVYEYMSQGDLGKHLFDKNNTRPLSWAQRLIICIGAAKGLHHLHSNAVIHRDVKPGNILVDHNWNAKLTDLALSRSAMMSEESSNHVTTRVMGTIGYVEPRYMATGHLTYKSDIYAFGVVMMEALIGRRFYDPSHDNLDEWRDCGRREKILESEISPQLVGNVSLRSFHEYSALVLKCVADEQSERPGMGEVINKLHFLLQLQEDFDNQRYGTRHGMLSSCTG